MNIPLSKSMFAGAVLVLLICIPKARGQSHAINWSTIDGGGVTFASGGPYSLGGTTGQADAGASSGGVYELTGGFWAVPFQTGDCGRLNIRMIGGNVEISWSTDSTGCVLEQCNSLAGTPLWAPVSPAPAAHLHTAPVLNAPRFYRLRKP